MFSDRIKEARIRLGLKQDQVATAIGVAKSTYTGYERGNSEPDLRKIELLMAVLKVDANFLLQDEMARHGNYASKISPEDQNLLEQWRKLDSYGKEAVKALMQIERMRYESAHKSVRLISIPVYTDPAAAGVPLYAESDFERMDFSVDEVPDNAEFGIRISGDSMEPSIHDGQIVWIKRSSTIADNHVGVFMLSDGTAVCKRASTALDGRIQQLLSDNSAYDPLEGDTLDGLRIVGEVLNA